MQKKPLTSFVRDGEILTSNELIGRLTDSGISAENARQLMVRRSTRDQVWRSDKLKLPRNQRLFARQPFRDSPDFLNRLIQALDRDRAGLARCLRRLRDSKVLLLADVARLTGSTVTGQTARIPSLAKEIDALVDTGACVRVAENTVFDRLVVRDLARKKQSGAMAFDACGAQAKESMLCKLLVDYYRRTNILSWGGYSVASMRKGYTLFSDLAFSAFGYSFLAPLIRWRPPRKKPSPCPTLIDVQSRRCCLDDVQAFQLRLQRSARGDFVKNPRLGLVAAPEFEDEAWAKAKELGLITINLRQMFGDGALDLLGMIEEIVKNLPGRDQSVESGDPVKLAAMLKEFKNNPFVNELRSIAFEAVAALVLRSKGFEEVEIGLVVPWNDKKQREIDVFGLREDGKEVFIVECKAQAGGNLENGVVKKFFTQSVPAVLKERGCSNATSVYAEIWTTGDVGSDARKELSELELKPRLKPRLKGFDAVAKSLTCKLVRCKRLLEVIRLTEDTV